MLWGDPRNVGKSYFRLKGWAIGILIPRAVSPGATVGIIAPASPYDRYSDIERGIAWWESHQYHVKLAKSVLARANYVAGPPEMRAADVTAMFIDPAVDAIQCLRGGYGSAEMTENEHESQGRVQTFHGGGDRRG